MSENISDMELAASKDIVSFWLDAKAVEHEKLTAKDESVQCYKPRRHSFCFHATFFFDQSCRFVAAPKHFYL
jgi:hypothetical protein